MACNAQELFNNTNWAGWCTASRYKHPRSLTELIILPLFQKNSHMGFSKMNTVYSQTVQVIPSEKTKESQGKQGCQLEVTKASFLKATDHFPHQSRRQGFLPCRWFSQNSPGSIDHLLHDWILAWLLVTTLAMDPTHAVHCRINRRHRPGLLNEKNNVQ